MLERAERHVRATFYRRHGKRLLDVGLGAALLVALSPVLGIVAVLVRWRLGRPVLFRQDRPGKDGRPFVMLKFRTMRDALDSSGAPLPDAERLTAFGARLRSFSLDELPELLNVLKGDMSLVGPRPLLMRYLPLYSAAQSRRHEVLPGITGWAQIHGRTAATWERRFELDVWYADRVSLGIDLLVLALTLWKVLRREGVPSAGRVTESEFRGSTAGPIAGSGR